MVLAEVERVEVHPLGLDLGPLGDLPALRHEDVHEALLGELHRVPRPHGPAAGRHGDVDPLLDEDALGRLLL